MTLHAKYAPRLVRQDHRRHPRRHHRQGTARRHHRPGDRSPVRRGQRRQRDAVAAVDALGRRGGGRRRAIRRSCAALFSRRRSRSWGTSPRATAASPSRKSAPRARRCGGLRCSEAERAARHRTLHGRQAARIFRSKRPWTGCYRLAGGQPDLCRLFVQIQLEAALLGNGLSAGRAPSSQRICRALRHFAARVRLARGHAAHARQRRVRAARSRAVRPGARAGARSPTLTRCSACRRVQRMPRSRSATGG